jgi:hypothetical protein
MNQPPELVVEGCPDRRVNGLYQLQPNKMVNGKGRYFKTGSFYYL